jgi:lysozyme
MKRIGLILLFVIAAFVAAGALYWFGIWIPNEPSISRLPVRGIDVSHHQQTIDWPAVKRAGMQFAYIKATEGADSNDPGFMRNWADSATATISHGAYHFFTLGTPGKQQAENFVSVVPVEPGALPPAIDLEFSGYNLKRRPAREDFVKELAAFYDALLIQYQQVPVIYTTYDFKDQYLKNMPVERLWFREIFTRPRIGNEKWTFWQFSARGRVPGVSGPADLNVFNGDVEAFDRLLSGRR